VIRRVDRGQDWLRPVR